MLKPYATPQVVTRASAISPAKRQRIVELIADGLTARVVAERLGLHPNTITNWLRRLGRLQARWCSCGRRIAGNEPRCYVCRGYRDTRPHPTPRASYWSPQRLDEQHVRRWQRDRRVGQLVALAVDLVKAGDARALAAAAACRRVDQQLGAILERWATPPGSNSSEGPPTPELAQLHRTASTNRE